jgi:hypothetical protein
LTRRNWLSARRRPATHHTLLISGESYRLREKRRSGLIRSRLADTDRQTDQREPEIKSGPAPGPDRKNR